MIDYKSVRKVVQDAVGNDTVIKIHPLDMAELLNEKPSEGKPLDILSCKVVNEHLTDTYIIIGNKVYYQTVGVQRRIK